MAILVFFGTWYFLGMMKYLTPGSHAQQIMAMQQALKDKGFDPGPIDGTLGPRTTSALKEYQKSENLTMTGKMDHDTAAKLGVKK